MSTHSLPVSAARPIVRVQVGFSRGRELAIRRAGRAVLAPLTLDGLIDTGADVSMIEHGFLTPFVREGMDLKGFVNVKAPGLGGLALRPQFLCGLRISHPSGNARDDLVIPAIEVVEHALGAPPGYQVLLGRDVLARCVLEYNGPANTFSLTY